MAIYLHGKGQPQRKSRHFLMRMRSRVVQMQYSLGNDLKVMMSQVEQSPRLVMGGYGRHESQCVNINFAIWVHVSGIVTYHFFNCPQITNCIRISRANRSLQEFLSEQRSWFYHTWWWWKGYFCAHFWVSKTYFTTKNKWCCWAKGWGKASFDMPLYEKTMFIHVRDAIVVGGTGSVINGVIEVTGWYTSGC